MLKDDDGLSSILMGGGARKSGSRGSYLDSPMYQRMLAQTLQGQGGRPQYPMEAGANALAQMLQIYSLKQMGEKQDAEALKKETAGNQSLADIIAPPEYRASGQNAVEASAPISFEGIGGQPQQTTINAGLPDYSNANADKNSQLVALLNQGIGKDVVGKRALDSLGFGEPKAPIKMGKDERLYADGDYTEPLVDVVPEAAKLPDGMRMGANGPEWIPGYIGGRQQISASGAPRTVITNDMRQEGAYSTARGGQFAEMAKGLDESAGNAAAGLNNMAIIDAALSAPGVYQGSNQESINTLRKFGSTVLGMDLKGIPETDVARSVGNQLALDLKKDTKDPSMSSSELAFYQMIPPGLSNTLGGNKVLIDIRTKKYQRDLGVAKLARDYERKNGQLDAGFVEERAKFLEKNRINTPEMVQRIRQLAASPQQQQPQPSRGQQGPRAAPVDDLLNKYPQPGQGPR